MTIDLKGRWVWVTGASSGIGSHLALDAARRGACVLLSGRNTNALERMAAECQLVSHDQGHAGGHRVLAFDLLDRTARRRAAHQALEVASSFALVVLNAGISQRSRFAQLPPEAFDQILDLDFMAPVDLVRELLPSLESGSGLVLVSSVAGLIGSPGRSAYSSAKHALAGFGAVLRSELYERKISVTVAFPGYVRTSLDKAALGPDGKPQGVKDARNQAGAFPEPVARQILGAAVRRKPHAYVAFNLESYYAIFAARYLPGLYARFASQRKN